MLRSRHVINFLIVLLIFPIWLNAESGKININTATAEDLDSIPGIGPAKAEMIIIYRDKHGPFKSLDDLDDVPGVGPKMLETISQFVEFGTEAEKPTTTNNASAPIQNQP